MSLDELTLQSAMDLSSMITKGDLSPVEITQAYLARIEKYSHLNAYITVDYEEKDLNYPKDLHFPKDLEETNMKPYNVGDENYSHEPYFQKFKNVIKRNNYKNLT